MTIYLDSRYADGPLFMAQEPKSGNYMLSIFRTFPSYKMAYYWYEVTENDRIENIATKTIGNPNLWWQIMDINPDVLDPFTLKPGLKLRIPRE
jgi:nucleoid-associated protein YgaU